MLLQDKYEAVIGLEVHAQLATNSKLFCGDSTAFGASPNTHISPVTMGHPGTLPKTNKKAVEYAIRMGLACNCEIEKDNYFARKNYFYPDLPKGYQTSQHTTPICKGGHVTIKTASGERNVQLNRIHMEEDAGKSIHDMDDHFTCIDLNRAGTPLVEIVTEPDLFSADEAWQYVTEVRRLVRWIGICDGNMEEGSLRCDANVSIRLKGAKELGTKVEVKNLNSIRNVKKAIDYEINRMIELAEKGERIIQQTRSFNADNDTTFALRDKEEANDYRYFADPDLPAFVVTPEMLADITAAMPELPEQLVQKYIHELKLPEYDARVICDDASTIQYFNELIGKTPHYKSAANWLLGPIKSYLNENNSSLDAMAVRPASLAALIAMVEDNQVSFSVASSRIFPEMIKQPSATALE